MTGYLVMVPIGYLLGALPFGLIIVWVLKRVDVRDYGSGKMGMTNVMRIAGVPAAIAVLLLDMSKAVVAVAIARALFDSAGAEAAVGLAALFGHNWPVFSGFRGGRGIATGWGCLFILHPIAGLVATAVGVPVVAATRYVSLGSLLGATSGVVALIVLAVTGHAPLAYIWFGAIGGALVVFQHRDNIGRLLKGQERKLGQRAEAAKPNLRAGRSGRA